MTKKKATSKKSKSVKETEVEAEVVPTSEEDQPVEEDKGFYLGKCVETGKDLFKKLPEKN